MAETGAIFGGEHSGHYYFRDNFRADSGMIAALLVLEAMSRRASLYRRCSSRTSATPPRARSTPRSSDQQRASREARAEATRDGKQDLTDGLTVEYEDWWFNCRPSNTEPLLRLNLEARTEELMEDEARRGPDGHQGRPA